MTQTTIALSESTKQLLDDHKQGHESYDDVVRRLAGNGKGQLWTDEEIRSIVKEELERIRV